MARQFWSIKSEPFKYPFERLVADGHTRWDGVRNFEARNHLRAMNLGDLCLFYHSNEGKAVVGLARVSRTAYPDPTGVDGEWSAVDIEPVRALGRPVSLDEMRRNAVIGKMVMMRRPRLSVVPVTKGEFDAVIALSRTKTPT